MIEVTEHVHTHMYRVLRQNMTQSAILNSTIATMLNHLLKTSSKGMGKQKGVKT